ncbi:MAG: tRNA uridine 5-carboxymethylaminomethyl modification enzyme MnmG [Chlamydiae bacterium]|nr:tRNA uridine 5-carboxymethylaminomethyl modification enzyme MnmG [Chlamydiota bacterium]
MYWEYPEQYDVIVIGGGHAGCEAALASARMGCKTLLLSMSLDTIAKMSCNPAIGGTAKGHMVREIDALGGEMGVVADLTAIQFRMLNDTKGPAVWAPRCQSDRVAYQFEMRHRLEKQENLFLKQCSAQDLKIKNGVIQGVFTKEGIAYLGKTVILCSGTFMRGLIHIGEKNLEGGRAGDPPSNGLSATLQNHGLEIGRLKTGTPPRIHSRSIDFSLTEEQPGMDNVKFSFDTENIPRLPQVPCYITYTTAETKKIIQENIHRSPMYSGKIQSIGPRYCPSIEDKIIRFSDKERHQIFLEPEGLQTEEYYVNGVSSSLPFDVQLEFIRSVPALRNAEITRVAYAIEYDYVLSGQISNALETHAVKGLFLAGQINGTTGYEEAASQGLISGINAALKVQGKETFTLSRSEAYIGVMIDDLITKGVDEPYRMFTSRAEYRLLLRQDNADLRLREKGYQLGLIDEERYQKFLKKKTIIEEETKRLQSSHKQVNGKGVTLAQLLCHPKKTYQSLMEEYPEDFFDHGPEINFQLEMLKYAGYIERQAIEVKKLSHTENVRIPADFDYARVVGLRAEAQQKLGRLKPKNLGQASRIPGVSPADIIVLMVVLNKHAKQKSIA